MALERIIDEIQKLTKEEKVKLLHQLRIDLDEVDPMERFIGSVKKLEKPSNGSKGYEEDLYGGEKPL